MRIRGHLDLFSGIGGFSLGLERAGVETEWIGYSDIDKHCNQVFKRRFKNAENMGDIKKIRTEDLPRLDLVTFGFPCQDLSVANIKRKGLKGGERSSLFFEATRIIRDKKPKYFICENVRGLFSSNKGQDFIIVLQEFADIGYDVQWELLNTKCEGGLPQNRERVYIIGHLRGESRPQVFPLGRYDEKNNGIKGQHTNTLTSRYNSGGVQSGSYIIEGKQQEEEVKIADWRSDEGLRIRKNNISPTLTLATPPYIINGDIRKITPVEAARLQGFPDDWNDCQSDSQRYKQYGNAITVNVAESIFNKLYKEK